jgi:tripartite-type tricarboxylate transporter receptor subunit TctC
VFFATNSTHAASVHLAEEPSFDPVHSFLPVTLTSLAPLVLMVRTDFPARTVEEFIAVRRAKAGALTYQTGNIGSLTAAQLLRSLTGLAAEQISYRGTPAAVTGLLAGRLQFLVSDLTAAGDPIRAATLRALGLTSAQHIPMLPDVPTLQEAEVPGYEFASRVAVFCRPVARRASRPGYIGRSAPPSTAMRESAFPKASALPPRHRRQISLRLISPVRLPSGGVSPMPPICPRSSLWTYPRPGPGRPD